MWLVKCLYVGKHLDEVGVVTNINDIKTKGNLCSIYANNMGSRIIYSNNLENNVGVIDLYDKNNMHKLNYQVNNTPFQSCWNNGDIIKIILDCIHWNIQFFKNNQPLSQKINIHKNMNYFPIISTKGKSHYKILQ